MKLEVIGTGKTVQEAIDNACRELGHTTDEPGVSFETLEIGRKGGLFRKAVDAKVRVVFEKEESKAETARTFVQDVLNAMEIKGEVSIASEGESVVLSLKGEDIGAIIGRRGGTLDALQYLTGLVANRVDGTYCRITLDCENYREKREKTLEALAKRLAGNALKNNKSVMLEPMNPYERRIIHATVQKIEGVTSASTGDEPNRRVVIHPTGSAPRTDRPARSDRGPRGDRGPRNDRGERRGDRRNDRPRGSRPERTERTEAPVQPQTAPKAVEKNSYDDQPKPLYGRIEIE